MAGGHSVAVIRGKLFQDPGIWDLDKAVFSFYLCYYRVPEVKVNIFSFSLFWSFLKTFFLIGSAEIRASCS